MRELEENREMKLRHQEILNIEQNAKQNLERREKIKFQSELQ